MLSDLIQAVIDLMASVGAPVYLADCVPADAFCPYITLAATVPGTLTLTIWHRDHASRINMADAITALLPMRGKHIPLDSGAAILTGGRSTLLKEDSVYGLRMVWKLRLYPSA